MAALVGLTVLVCVLVSDSPASTSATMSPSPAMSMMPVSSADAVVDPVLQGPAAGSPATVTDCGGMGGSGAAHGCVAAVSALALVAFAFVLAIVADGWVRRASPVPGPTGYAVEAWGAPPWTVLTRSQLAVIRV